MAIIKYMSMYKKFILMVSKMVIYCRHSYSVMEVLWDEIIGSISDIGGFIKRMHRTKNRNENKQYD